MKLKMLLLISCMVCLFLALLASCQTHGILSDDFVAGDTVTPEELLEISREIFTETSEPTQHTKEAQTLSPDATVYWLPGGSVYHAVKDCRHIAHADPENVREGFISTAMAEGKERLCSTCAP